ncbi:hypothetical protein [Actinoplanes sp. NPDC020271]|uniref:hypothetical protein n=1 Tax=Actinoplanes sp. NPDC020271 TaxID=3363896 RepID=UPI00378FA1EB
MRYLEPTSPVMALMWMTAVDQCLGTVRRDGVWRVRWVRVDPLADAPGVLVSAHEDDLAVDIRALEQHGVPELVAAADLPMNFVAHDEAEALSTAERELGARKDRWVNHAVEGWAILCEWRGHA